MDKANQEELADIFAEIEYEGHCGGISPAGHDPGTPATIGPMFVGRKLEEIGWESVPINDPRITVHPTGWRTCRSWTTRMAEALKSTKRSALRRNGDGWRAWLCHPMTSPGVSAVPVVGAAAGLPTPDEWAYLRGGGCRTLFSWGMDWTTR